MDHDDGSRRVTPPIQLVKMGLYKLYHRQWWCYRHQLQYYKWWNACLNGLALLLVSTGMIVGPILKNRILVPCLAAAGTFVKGWSDFKHYRFKAVLCHFAYTTYAKALMEIRTLTCAEDFQKKMATADEIVVDLTPPLPPTCIQKYQQLHQTVVDGPYKNEPLTNPTVTPWQSNEKENPPNDGDD